MAKKVARAPFLMILAVLQSLELVDTDQQVPCRWSSEYGGVDVGGSSTTTSIWRILLEHLQQRASYQSDLALASATSLRFLSH
jgi:hypothetical protein